MNEPTEKRKAGRRKWLRALRGVHPRRPNRVAVLERLGEREWKAIEAEVTPQEIKVLRTHLPAADAIGTHEPWQPSQLAREMQIILVADSDRAVYRQLDVPPCPDEQMRRVTALQLETELPYPVAESIWVCERQRARGDGAAGCVLVIAAPGKGVKATEECLRASGQRCTGVEFHAAALAQWAVACAPAGETVAAVNVGPRGATLAIARSGELSYARQIICSGSNSDSQTRHLVNELDQSIQGYVFHAGGVSPDRVVLFGEGGRSPDFAAALRTRLHVPVAPAFLPQTVTILPPDVPPESLVEGFPAGVGALIATQCRLRAEQATAPAWRLRKRLLDKRGARVTIALAAASLLLFVGFIATTFAVRSAKLRAAERVIDETLPRLRNLEKLEEEIKILEKEARRSRSTLDLFLALAEVMPKGMSITTLRLDPDGRLHVTGKTPSYETAVEKAITAMEASPMFTKPRFLGATKEKQGINFTITCQVSKNRKALGK